MDNGEDPDATDIKGLNIVQYLLSSFPSYMGLLELLPGARFDADLLSPFLSPLKLFDLAKSQRRLLYTCAPMVRYSKAGWLYT